VNVTDPNLTEPDRARPAPIRAGRKWFCRQAVNYDPEISRKMWTMASGIAVGYITLTVVLAMMAFAMAYCVDLLS
jgi:ABC-type lipoprotein release transport system permease subunit